MQKLRLLLFCLVPILTVAGEREVTFYEVRQTRQEPVLNGKPDDLCWQEAMIHTRYFQYNKPNPQLSPLKTEFRAIYNERGIFVAIVNFDDKIELIRKNFSENDNIDLWRDDCAELYFDPEATGIGHTIFTINASGIKADRKKLDTVVYLTDWSGYNWLASASIAHDRWCLELFFPWEDLGKKASPGDLWQFLHTRYAWNPRFTGAASAIGADARVPEKFGYLFFAGKDHATPQMIAKILQGKVQVPCVLPVGEKLIRFTAGGTQIELLETVVSRTFEEYSLLLTDVKKLYHGQQLPKEILEIERQCQKLQQDKSLTAYQKLAAAKEELFKLKWECLLDLHFNLPKGDKAK